MTLPETFGRLGIALGLGLLVGLQRQRTDARLAGFRTFPLVTLLGALAGLLVSTLGAWPVAVALGGLTILVVGGNISLRLNGKENPGVTTEVALLVMYLIGAYLVLGSPPVAIAVCGVVAVLLHLKPEMHSLAARIGDRDFTAIMQFALISLVILPVLPNETYGPFKVLNPFRIWWMVVLIVGISLGGYIVYKFVGARAGVWTSGVLGGLISSTATTVGLARRSRGSLESVPQAAFVIMLASAIVFARLALLIGTTAPKFLLTALVPLASMFVLLLGPALWNLRARKFGADLVPDQENPTELKSAIYFGILYAVVLMAVAVAKQYFGQRGLYAISILSGLTDMDAIALSISQMVADSTLSEESGWRLILVASMSNLAFKAGSVAILSNRQLLRRVATGFGIAALGGGLLLAFWHVGLMPL